jgi:starvation-inducible DNA-binding protein
VKNKRESPASDGTTAQPRFHQRAAEIQAYGTVNHLLPLELEETVRLEMTAQLNQLLADTMTLRDLYKKSHWQVAGPTFYQLHLLFDKHFDEQVELSTPSPSGYNSSAASASRWRTMLLR